MIAACSVSQAVAAGRKANRSCSVVPALAKAFEDANILAPRLPRWKRWEEVAEKRIVRLFVDIVFDWVVLLVVGTVSKWLVRESARDIDKAPTGSSS